MSKNKGYKVNGFTISILNICTDNYYGYWDNNIYYAGIRDIGKTIQNPYSPVNNLTRDKERKREEDKRENKGKDKGESE